MSKNSGDVGTDDLGRRVGSDPTPQRIVSLVPSITELLFDLGVGSRLVGVTDFCTEPIDGVGWVEAVGGTKNPDIERILEIAPDLVLVDQAENRREDFDSLVAAGVPVFVACPRTVSESAATVERIAASVDAESVGRVVARGIRASLQRSRLTAKPVRVFCPIWRNPWMTFNRSVFGADVIRQAGGINVCDSDEEYGRLELADIAELDPEVVLLPDEPYLFRERHIETLTDLRPTAAWRNGRIHVVDGKGLFWYGRRTPEALDSLRVLFSHRNSD